MKEIIWLFILGRGGGFFLNILFKIGIKKVVVFLEFNIKWISCKVKMKKKLFL